MALNTLCSLYAAFPDTIRPAAPNSEHTVHIAVHIVSSLYTPKSEFISVTHLSKKEFTNSASEH